jgi:D-serine deaminase-like pyridoxal phosphate-dependent protein
MNYAVDSLLQIIPHHSCLAAACFAEYTVVDQHQQIVATWKTCTRTWHSDAAASEG